MQLHPSRGDFAIDHAAGGAGIGQGTQIDMHDEEQAAAECGRVMQQPSSVAKPTGFVPTSPPTPFLAMRGRWQKKQDSVAKPAGSSMDCETKPSSAAKPAKTFAELVVVFYNIGVYINKWWLFLFER